ncbi:uncharacterized protein N7511_008078 [Penicillium nucicola]|uniref:uncharacterized protein n=1 Tax=Penicillium nucicola TaxID=1850975 RepID=UPI00254541FD|nr:uncharacterized protein N7511_008078 [Penicillium nucicola]KAJ5753925.1 hypothetical protein N7511_008078 [Penicillium nucicola]
MPLPISFSTIGFVTFSSLSTPSLGFLNAPFPESFGLDEISKHKTDSQSLPRSVLSPLPGYPTLSSCSQPGSDQPPYATAHTTRSRYDPARGAASRANNDRLNPYDRRYRSREDQPPARARSRSPDTKSMTLWGEDSHRHPLPNSGDDNDQLQSGRLKSCGLGKELVEWKKEEEQKDPACEFSAPCRMGPSPDGMHWRKVVSHVFGRNKASTKLFPQDVWVHYCRKHYQRARYRADQWPFTQCDLLLESLNRMERWGGVENFQLILRRREQLRVESEPAVNGDEPHRGRTPRISASRKEARTPRALVASQRSRKHPTAINAPVPLWLRGLVGKSKSFENIRELIEHVRSYLGELRREEREDQMALTMSPSLSLSPRHAAGKARKRNGKPNGVKNNQRLQTSRVRFPDVEILPTFKPWVMEADLRQRTLCKQEAKSERQTPRRSGNPRQVEIDDSHDTENSLIAPAGVNLLNSLVSSSPLSEHTTYAPVGMEPSTSTTELDQLSYDQTQPRIEILGRNSGNLESEHCRGRRAYIESLNRVSGQGYVKKTHERKR